MHRLLPDGTEVASLLALMLLTDSRRAARTGPGGELIPLDEQDRARWDRALIAEGTALASAAVASATLGPYQLQAAIAATQANAERAQDTDWHQVHALYKILERIAPNPMVTLNRAVALAQTRGPRAGLELLAALGDDTRMAGHHRLHAVRAHLLEQAGDRPAARDGYRLPARATASLAEQRYLESRAARLDPAPGPP
ncbi:MAG TPA: DUF6596 domain-containing protein [Streptosporangiaceae bacterium]|nr:DUF6596 domain-containing protein [Streptosporangiaceae bacterium]